MGIYEVAGWVTYIDDEQLARSVSLELKLYRGGGIMLVLLVGDV